MVFRSTCRLRESNKLLRRPVNNKTHVVIMIIDINDSTEMAFCYPIINLLHWCKHLLRNEYCINRLRRICFFKYEGDAVISIFPAEYDQVMACKNALECSKAILEIIKRGCQSWVRTIWAAWNNNKNWISIGVLLVVLYGKNMETAHIDIIGSSISMATKITATAKANQILVGELICDTLLSSDHKDAMYYKHIFQEVNLNHEKWKYPSRFNDENIYTRYGNI